MANEAVLITQFSAPISITVADGVGIEKGTIMQLTDSFTGSASNGDNQTSLGIPSQEKISGDGRTKISIYVDGIFRVKDSGAGVTVGDYCKIIGANTVATADDAGALGANENVGKALETAAASDTFLIIVGRG